MSDYPVTFGTVTRGGKVHMAQAIRGYDQILCRFDIDSPSLETVLGTFPDGGAEATATALHAAKVRPARLCKHCFSAKFRTAYGKIGA